MERQAIAGHGPHSGRRVQGCIDRVTGPILISVFAGVRRNIPPVIRSIDFQRHEDA